MRIRASDDGGFTLLEVIIALAIFTAGILALYAAQTATIGYNSGASRITTAATWSAQTFESFMARHYGDLDDLNGDGVGGLNNATETTADYSAISPDGRYTILWNVVADMPIPRTKTIRVIVINEGIGVGRRIQMDYVKHETI